MGGGGGGSTAHLKVGTHCQIPVLAFPVMSANHGDLIFICNDTQHLSPPLNEFLFIGLL